MVHLESKRTESEPVDLVFHCPKCGRRQVPVRATGVTEENKLLHFIPLFSTRFTRLQCHACARKSHLKMPIAAVAAMSAEEMAEALSRETSFIAKALAIAALVVGILPIDGTGMAIAAVVVNLKSARGCADSVVCRAGFVAAGAVNRRGDGRAGAIT